MKVVLNTCSVSDIVVILRWKNCAYDGYSDCEHALLLLLSSVLCVILMHQLKSGLFCHFCYFNTDSQIMCSLWFTCMQGWKIDDVMMSIFQHCWPVMNKLHTIKYAADVQYFTCIQM